jgi:Fe-S cluster assembly scaffold protein SufB
MLVSREEPEKSDERTCRVGPYVLEKELWRFADPDIFVSHFNRLLKKTKFHKNATPAEKESFLVESSNQSPASEPWNSYKYFDLSSGRDWEEQKIIVTQSGEEPISMGHKSLQKSSILIEEGVESILKGNIQPSKVFQAHRIQVELRPGAHVKFFLNFTEGRMLWSVLKFVLWERSSLEIILSSREVIAHRLELEIQLQGKGSSAMAEILHEGRQNQIFDARTLQRHIACRTESHLKVKNALDDRAQSIFGGKIIMAESAMGAKASQKNQNLMLSEKTLAHSLPELEIHSKEVECSHGATIKPLEAGVLFYMYSRGIEARATKQLLKESFLGWEKLERVYANKVERTIQP